ncbi:IS3 family transposase [Spirosoma taeanense]|uniref:IS3 family transposase n=1 Tax=Spirosoma taeanense TaxID=2735870 RepID=A0A6M5YC53_9BACT|nr:IS3 family transposase [Spirosoma taeanense]QJW90831.1 IS3 family transposase [Spirosoma taeanense]
MVYKLVTELSNHHPIQVICHALEISRSAYYEYRRGLSYQVSEEKRKLIGAMQKSFADHRRRYGSRRLTPELQEQGYSVGRHQLRRLMRREGLRAIQPRSFIPRTTDSRHNGPLSPNLLADSPFPAAPGCVLVGDITYIPLVTGEWAYLAAWMDLYSRLIAGWQIELHMEESLVHEALKKALLRRKLNPNAIVHSDRGGQYIGKSFRNTLLTNQIQQSMSRPNDPYDNAFMESCWSRLKAELLENGAFRSLEDARTELFDYIECYYNRKRRHSSLGNISPEQFEQNYYLMLNQNLHS